LKRLVAVVAGALALWIAILIVLGMLWRGRVVGGVMARVGESLAATAAAGDSDLALVRGTLAMDHLHVERDDLVGHLQLDVDHVRAALPAFGGALFDHGVRELAVRGVRMRVSAAALFAVPHPKHPPMHVRRFAVDDAALTFAPSAFVPELGAVTIRIDHAASGDTVMRTPLSWLLSLDELRASIELPAGLTLALTYAAGQLTAAGTLFGKAPVTIPVSFRPDHTAADAHEETQQLIALGKDIAERLVARRATEWLEHELH
jgi:hypothetical protein